MRHLMFDAPGQYRWTEAPEPTITSPSHAVVRPLAVACCDLDVGVGDAVTTVREGDHVVVPFQISCGECRTCRRGATGSCGSLPLMAMYGMAPLAGLDGGGFMADLVLVPYADAMLLRLPEGAD